MKKSALLLSCSFLFMAQAYAIDATTDEASDHLKLIKDAYTKKFEQMDADKNGVVDEKEYLKHQFEVMREVVLTTSGFEDIKETPAPQKIEVEEENITIEEVDDNSTPTTTSEKPKTLDDFSATLEEMATFDLDFEEELSVEQDKKRLTKEDVMPDLSEPAKEDEIEEYEEETLEDASDSIDELLEEDKEIEDLIAKTAKQIEEAKSLSNSTPDSSININKEEVKVVAKEPTKEDKINKLLEDSRKNLPQKIDEITTCTDIFYKNDMIVYNYSVNMDISAFSKDELALLQSHIKTEACLPIYKEKCPEIAPVFINDGTNVKIQYIDKNGKEISYCELNKTTCQ